MGTPSNTRLAFAHSPPVCRRNELIGGVSLCRNTTSAVSIHYTCMNSSYISGRNGNFFYHSRFVAPVFEKVPHLPRSRPKLMIMVIFPPGGSGCFLTPPANIRSREGFIPISGRSLNFRVPAYTRQSISACMHLWHGTSHGYVPPATTTVRLRRDLPPRFA